MVQIVLMLYLSFLLTIAYNFALCLCIIGVCKQNIKQHIATCCHNIIFNCCLLFCIVLITQFVFIFYNFCCFHIFPPNTLKYIFIHSFFIFYCVTSFNTDLIFLNQMCVICNLSFFDCCTKHMCFTNTSFFKFSNFTFQSYLHISKTLKSTR